MLTFRTVTLKNFLSIGDNPVTIRLDKSPTTLVSGKNGVGKTSIMTDSLCFALFGKAFRDIKKHRLINTVNQRDSLVELVFDVGSNQYKIIRGQKPNIFEVYLNDTKLNDTANVKDMQRYLEDQIIKFDYNVFSRVVVMSSMNYTPFLHLNTHERRKFVESILSLVVYSEMNNLHRQNVSRLKQEITAKSYEVDSVKTKLDAKNQVLTYISNAPNSASNTQFIKSLLSDIETEKDKLSKYENSLNEVPDNEPLLTNLAFIDSNINNLRGKIHKLEASIHVLTDKMNYLESNSTCIKCDQSITDDYKIRMLSELTSERDSLQDELDKLTDSVTQYQISRDKLSKKIDLITSTRTTIERSIQSQKAMILRLSNQVKALTEGLTDAQKDTSNDKKVIQGEIQQLNSDLESHNQDLEDLKITENIYSIVSSMLKDDGIKLELIRQYIPVLISNTNYYLSKMNIPLKFHIDELFNDTIVARYSDELEYNSLSAGERARVDIALNLAWIKTAKSKGGINTNLLVLDEIADNSLDQAGTTAMLDIINNELGKDMNIFIISHKTNLDENVQSILALEKVNGFTRIV